MSIPPVVPVSGSTYQGGVGGLSYHREADRPFRGLVQTGFNKETWNMGWTCIEEGCLSWTTEKLMTETVSYSL